MSLKVAVQMDPIERINIRGDSTFALLLEAQRRGHAIAYYTPDRLGRRGGGGVAAGRPPRGRRRGGGHSPPRRPPPGAGRRVPRGPAAPGSALRPRLYHHHASARARASEDAGGQRP